MPKLPARTPHPGRQPASRLGPAEVAAEFERIRASRSADSSRARLPTPPVPEGMHADEYLALLDQQEARQRQREKAELDDRFRAEMEADPGLRAAYAEIYGEGTDGQ
jgi:hypothetical protein